MGYAAVQVRGDGDLDQDGVVGDLRDWLVDWCGDELKRGVKGDSRDLDKATEWLMCHGGKSVETRNQESYLE